MTRNFLLPAAGAALFLSTAAYAGIGDPVEHQELAAPTEASEVTETEMPVTRARVIQIPRTQEPEAPSALTEPMEPAAPVVPAPAKLVSFDGGEEVLKSSQRLRIWRSHLAYRLTVDAEGNPTDCELTEKFRRKYISVKLCEVLIAHHQFEPARDANDMPVEGEYSNRLSYLELRNAKDR